MVGGWNPDGVDDGGVWSLYKLEVSMDKTDRHKEV
jgi:hypothetical protein